MGLSFFEKFGQRDAAENKAEKRGANVLLNLKFIRHGERDPQGNLLDYGRTVTAQYARARGPRKGEYHAVKAIGSTAGPVGKKNMQRSLETADIYAESIVGKDMKKTRPSAVLSYEKLVNKSPYNHTEVYNAALPKNYEQLSDTEKAKAAHIAQVVAVNHVFSLKTDEAGRYKREVAGSYAYVLDHYIKLSQRLKSGSKVFMPAGGHGGLMEFLLHYALVREVGGRKVRGFANIDEIGGAFDPSESYDIKIVRDSKGELGRLALTFDSPSRPRAAMYLDLETIKELAEHYRRLHPKTRVIGLMDDFKTPAEKKALQEVAGTEQRQARAARPFKRPGGPAAPPAPLGEKKAA